MWLKTTRVLVKFSPQAVFWLVWALLLGVKVVIAARLGLFSDEAFYWQESRHLDWSYSDLPSATAILIRFGETLFGHSELALRVPFLLLGAALPLLVVRMGSRLFGARDGAYAGLLTLSLPLFGSLGLLALPDVPLTFFAMLALLAFERAASDNRWRDWTLLGLALAGAWLSHYRAAMLLLAGLVFLLGCVRGRGLWRQSGLWVALGLSVLGLLPIVWFNATHDWAAIGFQLIDRHPWTFHVDGFVQPLEQALVYTPFMYALLLLVAMRCWHRAHEGAPWDLLTCAALVPLLGYFVIGCFADDTRFRVHWPLPGYLPLLLVMPAVLRDWWSGVVYGKKQILQKSIVVLAISTAGCGLLFMLGYFALAADAKNFGVLTRMKAFPEHFVGNREAANAARVLLANPQFSNDPLVADNFELAAGLDFELAESRPVYSLDHPLNHKHGRAAQLAIWQRDEAALRALKPVQILLVIEPTARRERERANWLDRVCERITPLKLLDRLNLFDGRKQYRFYQTALMAEPDLAAASACRTELSTQ